MKDLKFLGIGSAFNTVFGNTSAYFFCGDTMVMFDCGESIFSRVEQSDILNGIKKLLVFTTHNHPDHIGSLGSLIFYCYLVKKIPVEVYGNPDLKMILGYSGVRDEMYVFNDLLESYPNPPIYTVKPVLGAQEYSIMPIHTKHMDRVVSVGFHVKEKVSGESFYYSGDAFEIPETVRKAFLSGAITYLYQDTSWLDYVGNVHMSYKKLCEAIDRRRDFVYVMHTDKNFNFEKAIHDGFKVAGKN